MAGIHATNVHIVYAAVSDEDGGWLPFYYGHIPNADSLTDTTGSGRAIYVRSISLDSFIQSTGLVPQLIKMDIEGAEYRALLGMEKFIRSNYPPLVLEIGNSAEQPHKYLTDLGYQALNLSNYIRFEPMPEILGHSNVLYIHASNPRGAKYLKASISEVRGVPIDRVIENAKSDFSLPLGDLEEGRYIVEFESRDSARAESTQLEVAVGIPNQILALQIAPVKVLTADKIRMVAHMDRRSSAYVIIKGLNRKLLNTHFTSVKIMRVNF
jgi:hypothetical protein